MRLNSGRCRVPVWFLIIVWLIGGPVWAQVDISFPQPAPEYRVSIDGDVIQRWSQGAWDIYHAQGNVQIGHGSNQYLAGQAILWVDASGGSEPTDVLVYLEQDVQIRVPQRPDNSEQGTGLYTDEQWFGRLRTGSGIHVAQLVQEIAGEQAPAVFSRAVQRRQQELNPVQPVQYVTPSSPDSGLTLVSPVTGRVQQLAPPVLQNQQPSTLSVTPGGAVLPVNPRPGVATGNATTDVQILPRNPSIGGNIKIKNGSIPGERILVSTGGTRVNIDSQELGALDQLGQPRTRRLVIQADNVVVWENPIQNADGSGGSRYEIYLEGNVVFAMGNRVIYADRMYYDATFQRGTILAADVLTPVPSYQGLMRLKADVIQQLGEDQLQAYGAAVTSSRLGVPRYWLQSDAVTLNRQDRRIVDPATGTLLVDPATGQPATGDQYTAESRDNTVYIGGVPVFYWPVLRTDLDNPGFYIDRIRFGNDAVFGTQIGVGLDMFQLLGIPNAPENIRWVGLLDYFSERGLGFGSDVDYTGDSFFGIPGRTEGFLRAWFINDSGLDNLGRDRRAVPPETGFRGRVLARQRQILASGATLRSEVGWVSDRNFLEQYYEYDWDQDIDYTTGLWWQRNIDNQSFNLQASVRLNDFFTQTEWQPRGDHFIIGQPVFFDRAVWHGKSTIGYGRFRTAQPPTNPVDAAKWFPLAWEGFDRQGVVAGTRQEIDIPIQAGPVKVVPYLLGDASYWQQDLSGNDLLRLYGQAGIRSSLPWWRVDPTIHSTLLNLNGLAHKVSWDNEFLYADANQNLDELVLYNQLDDDSQEAFTRRLQFNTFGGPPIPLRSDERFFALRSGQQSIVSSTAMEIADDLTIFRTGLRNRWQTKRGLPGEARIIDWVTFDIQASIFPKADRDNFGEDLGLVNYDFTWHVGNRLTLISDGYFDFFSQGLRTASFGGYITRPGAGNLFLQFRTIEGVISSNVLTGAASYRMSDKWIFRGAASIDFGQSGNTAQSLGFVRVGESFLINFGVTGDVSQDNVGFVFGIEPRFVPGGRLGLVGGRSILPASSTYLE